jgi:DNA-directed RNA polymerase specialized sigma24 family protein
VTQPAYRLALSILRSESDARDAVQETFVAAWRELPRLRDPVVRAGSGSRGL